MIRKLLPYFGLALLFYLVAFAHNAHAQTPCPTGPVPADAARLCWTNATQNVDGSAIPSTGPAALKETRVRRSLCAADGSFGAIIEALTVPATIGVTLFEGLPPGRHCFQVRHFNNAGEASAWTAPARKTTTSPAPPTPRQPDLTIA